jgi:beta-lactamase superfamily II metal-dependent hydrolase
MIRYVKKRWTTLLFRDTSGDDDQFIFELLWGDRVRVLSTSGDWSKVKARSFTGFVKTSHLGTQSRLELYFIDVGQGDGVLVRTPDHRHVLIDGGWPRRSQPTGKNAADFVDWKFSRDYGQDTIHLDAMICSHNDQDHYGGLWDLLDTAQEDELDASDVAVDAFYHAGLSWWKTSSGRSLGPSKSSSDGAMWTRLLGDRASLAEGLKTTGSKPKLQGEWRKFLSKVSKARTLQGQLTPVSRLSDKTQTLPGFADAGGAHIRVLGPVEFQVDGAPAIRKFTSNPSQNTNGNSVLLRIDYKSVRILLTGDLNTRSQQALLKDYDGRTGEFACDVAKACHHGSGDVSMEFLKKVNAACTIISSGDSEGHDHPRPEIVAACGVTGFQQTDGDKLVTPMVFSTELARSVALGRVTHLDRLTASGSVQSSFTGDDMSIKFRTRYKVVMAGARSAKSGSAKVGHRRLATRTTYGLINVRTDGKTVMCAALNEKDFTWNVFTFKARF